VFVGALLTFQVAPKLVEIQTPALGTAATNLSPSADEATLAQLTLVGALVKLQDPPKSDDVQIPPPSTAATILIPFVEQVTDDQVLLGALLKFQFVPELVE
jgi:hypothetical protein